MTSASPLPTIDQQLADATECPICREVFIDPRTLPCLHTYCFRCINQWGADLQPGDELKCPECRTEFVIPDGGLGALPKSFFMERLKRLKESSPPECDDDDDGTLTTAECNSPCQLFSSAADNDDNVDASTSDKKRTSTAFCVYSRQTCEGLHAAIPVSRSHSVVKLGADQATKSVESKQQDRPPSAAAVSGSVPAMCAEHSVKQLEMFCFDCRAVLCVICFAERHASHDFTYVDKAADQFRARMRTDATSLTGDVANCERVMRRIADDEAAFLADVDRTSAEIRQRADDVVRAIERHRNRLLDELAGIREARLTQIREARLSVVRHSTLIENVRACTEELADDGSTVDVARQAGALHDRVEQLLELDVIQRSVRDLGSICVAFKPTELATADDAAENLVGVVERRVLVESSSSSTIDTSEFAVNTSSVTTTSSPTVVHVIPDGRVVVALATHGNLLFVARWPSRQQIEVYDAARTFALDDAMPIAGCGDFLSDLASCPVNRCLYASDYDNQTVHRVRLPRSSTSAPSSSSSSSKKALKTLLSFRKPVAGWSVTRPTGVSVTRDSLVLVTCWTRPFSTLRLFTTRGSLVRDIALQSDVFEPLCAAQLGAGQYVVGHGRKDSGPHRVCTVDETGRVLCSYTGCGELPGTSTSDRRGYNMPISVAVCVNGSGEEQVLVADKYNDRIVVLNGSLSRSRDLVVSVDGGLQRPNAILYEETHGRLYVGEAVRGRVIVLSAHCDDF